MGHVRFNIVGTVDVQAGVPTAWQQRVVDAAHEAIESTLDGIGINFRMGCVSLEPASEPVGSPGARRSDPDTSKQAAFEAVPRAKSHRRTILVRMVEEWVQTQSGMTYEDVGRVTGINGAWKRLSELHQGGWIMVIGERRTQDTKAPAQIYAPTSKAWGWWQQRG